MRKGRPASWSRQVPKTLDSDLLLPRTGRCIPTNIVRDLHGLSRPKPEAIGRKVHEHALGIVQPDPRCDSFGSLDAEALRQPREFEMRIDELGARQRNRMEPVLVAKFLRGLGIGQFAAHRGFHEEHGVGRVDAAEDASSVDVQGKGSVEAALWTGVEDEVLRSRRLPDQSYQAKEAQPAAGDQRSEVT